VALAATAGWGAWQSTTAEQNRSDRSFSAEEQVITTAKRSAEALLTYSYTEVQQKLYAAEELTTGEFRTEYRQFADYVVIPAAREKKVSTNAVVVGAGVQSLAADNAKVLLFVDQSTTSAAEPSAQLQASTILAGLQKVNGSWMISQFDPL
jgi:Mce-associated membrane protein